MILHKIWTPQAAICIQLSHKIKMQALQSVWRAHTQPPADQAKCNHIGEGHELNSCDFFTFVHVPFFSSASFFNYEHRIVVICFLRCKMWIAPQRRVKQMNIPNHKLVLDFNRLALTVTVSDCYVHIVFLLSVFGLFGRNNHKQNLALAIFALKSFALKSSTCFE